MILVGNICIRWLLDLRVEGGQVGESQTSTMVAKLKLEGSSSEIQEARINIIKLKWINISDLATGKL